MGYVEDNLMPDEEVMYRAHLHWVSYLRAVLLGCLGAAFLVKGLSNADLMFLVYLGGGAMVVAAIAWIVQKVKSWTSEFAVTNKRVIIKVGLIRRDTLEL